MEWPGAGRGIGRIDQALLLVNKPVVEVHGLLIEVIRGQREETRLELVRPSEIVLVPGDVAAKHGDRRLIEEHAAKASDRPVAACRDQQTRSGGASLRHRERWMHVDAGAGNDPALITVAAVAAFVVVARGEC